MTVVKEQKDERMTHLERMHFLSVRAPVFGNDRIFWKRVLHSVWGKLVESRLTPPGLQVSIISPHHCAILPLYAFFFPLCSCILPSQFAWGSLALSTWMTSSLVLQALGSHTLRNAVIYFPLGLMFIAKPAASGLKSRESTKKKCTLKIHNESMHIRYQHV